MTVQYNSQCAFATSLGKVGVSGNPRHNLVKENKTYYFLNPVAKVLFRIMRKQSSADKNWELQKKN